MNWIKQHQSLIDVKKGVLFNSQKADKPKSSFKTKIAYLKSSDKFNSSQFKHPDRFVSYFHEHLVHVVANAIKTANIAYYVCCYTTRFEPGFQKQHCIFWKRLNTYRKRFNFSIVILYITSRLATQRNTPYYWVVPFPLMNNFTYNL